MNRVNKDNPKTWKSYQAKYCDNCMALCCTMPVEIRLEDLVRLKLATVEEADDSIRKLVARLKKDKWIKSYRDATGLFTLEQNPQGDCVFLNSHRKCKVYDNRPNTCKKFPAEIGRRVGYCPRLLQVSG